MRIGLLHPGEMGAAVGAALTRAGHEVVWVAAGRSPATAARAGAAGLVEVETVSALAGTSEVVLSVCPPHAALDVARQLGPYTGLYLDANAVAPATTRRICQVIVDRGGRFVDGGIIGPPPQRPGTTRLYLSGPDAVEATEVLATPELELQVVADWPGSASALKLAYAAWTKGTAALLLAVRAAAAAEGVEAWLLDEWRVSQPELAERSLAAGRSALDKGWRWDGEMTEIAAMLEDDGLPGGFHRAAAEIFARSGGAPVADDRPTGAPPGAVGAQDEPPGPGTGTDPPVPASDGPALEQVVAALLQRRRPPTDPPTT